MYIAEKQIAWAESVGACDGAVRWLREEPRTIADVVERYASWLLEFAADRLTQEQFDECARRDPWAALRFAAVQLAPEQLDVCARQYPKAALKYAADRLTPKRLALCRAWLMDQPPTRV